MVPQTYLQRSFGPGVLSSLLLLCAVAAALPLAAQTAAQTAAESVVGNSASSSSGNSTGNSSGTIPAPIQSVISGHGLPSDSYSFVVQEIGVTQPLLTLNADQSLNPASTMKIITTLAALETLGPAYNWRTELYALGPIENGTLNGDLLLKGSGDPFLVEEQLRNMLKALQRAGVERISGNLILDGSYFDSSVVEEENIDNQAGRAYNTEPHAVLANFQTVTFYFYPHQNGNDVVIRTDPRLPNLYIDNRLRQHDAACSGYQRGITFDVNQNRTGEIIFSGQFPSRCNQFQMTREVLDAPGYTFGLFKSLWQEIGGELQGSQVLGTVPDDQDPLLVWSSSPLSDVIKSINKFSNNLMTRHLLLTLGAEQLGPPATVEKGREVVAAWLGSKELDSTMLVLENGAGLSRDARITTGLMTSVLQDAWRSPWMPEFLASLPLNGMDGTMRNRLQDGNMRGRMHIKTGSLAGVSAVAGYVHAQSGKVYTVSGIINHELADRGPGIELMDALLAWVYTR
jgi:D-alanyl-D-alanine carboxypeptidase/D-alanyl-D-alanine-endopeptidase (penicillin-binding protein 4)